MRYTLLRNATALLEIGGRRFLIDPMLDPARARPAVANTPNPRPNPLVELPAGWEAIVGTADALVVTHLHKDHFDETAARLLDHDLPLFCQPPDLGILRDAGFRDLRPVDREAHLDGVRIVRTDGHHGTGEIGARMAPVSGFVFEAPGDATVYVAGDTIWSDEVAGSIAACRPDVIVVNAGGARFQEGDPIVMTAPDIARVHAAAPEAVIVVVHLEAINHCLETRAHYRAELPRLGVPMERVVIPVDGECVSYGPSTV